MRDPDTTGPCGRAWLYRASPDAKPHASISQWLVNRPGAHPYWQWWTVSVVHLRDLPGLKPAKKHYPEAEYEFMIFSIDPEQRPDPEPDDPRGYPHLVPLDVVVQFHGVTDRDAERICQSAISAIMNGLLSPDQDYRQAWKESIRATVSHFAAGKHVEH
jgi:hypothetical protein